MSILLFSNNASTTLATRISDTSTSLQVTGGGGGLFPSVATAQAFYFTIVKASSPTIFEICLATGRSGDNFNPIIRAQQGTAALTWSAGDIVAQLVTAGDLDGFVQVPQGQAQQGNYAIDTGTANAYVVNLSPGLNGHVIGMPIRWKAAD